MGGVSSVGPRKVSSHKLPLVHSSLYILSSRLIYTNHSFILFQHIVYRCTTNNKYFIIYNNNEPHSSAEYRPVVVDVYMHG